MKKGFTLIELLIVIAIMGVLSSLVLSNFATVRARSRDTQRKSDLRQIQAALENFRADQGIYPLSMVPCGQSFTNDGSNGSVVYMQKVPCDPSLGQSYTFSGTGTTYALRACLENTRDSQEDRINQPPCNGTSNWSFTLSPP